MLCYIKKVVVAIVLLISFSANSYVAGNYPRLATIRTGSDNQVIASSDNFISNSIENGNSIPLVFNAKFLTLTPKLFPSKYFDSYTAERLNNEVFVAGLRELVSKFVCTEYRFRHGQPQAEGCSGYIMDERNKEKMPFVDGTYVNKRMEVHVDSKKYGVGYYFYLPSTSEKSLKTLWGAVHELGTFFGRSFDSNQLVLTVYVSTYPLSDSGYRSNKPFYENPLTFFVVLPSAKDIYEQKNHSSLGERSELLVLDL